MWKSESSVHHHIDENISVRRLHVYVTQFSLMLGLTVDLQVMIHHTKTYPKTVVLRQPTSPLFHGTAKVVRSWVLSSLLNLILQFSQHAGIHKCFPSQIFMHILTCNERYYTFFSYYVYCVLLVIKWEVVFNLFIQQIIYALVLVL